MALGHWGRVKKGMRRETRSRVGEGTMPWLSSLSFPDDSCHHHFPSLISGLTASPEPFLPSLTDNRCRLTDVSFRNCDLFTPIPGLPLPSFQAHGKKKTSQSFPEPARGRALQPLQHWASSLSAQASWLSSVAALLSPGKFPCLLQFLQSQRLSASWL